MGNLELSLLSAEAHIELAKEIDISLISWVTSTT